MDIALTILFYILYLTAGVLALLRWAHNLQLNSYQNRSQWRRFRQAPEKLFCLLPLVPALVFSFLPFPWAKIVTLVFLGISCLTLKPTKAKKPLVFTARVKRLLTVAAGLTVLFAAGGWFAAKRLIRRAPAEKQKTECKAEVKKAECKAAKENKKVEGKEAAKPHINKETPASGKKKPETDKKNQGDKKNAGPVA